jgi:hypothetical protein
LTPDHVAKGTPAGGWPGLRGRLSKFLLCASPIWPIIEHVNESREDELAVALPSNARTLFDTLAAARKARIAAEALELDTIHLLCVAFHTVDEDAFGEAASIGTPFSGTPYRRAGSGGGGLWTSSAR